MLNVAPTRDPRSTARERTGQFLANWRWYPCVAVRLGCWSIWTVGRGRLIMAMAIGRGCQSQAATQQRQFGGAAGVAVDAEGVLHTKVFADPGGQLMRERIAAAKATLEPEGHGLQQAAKSFAESAGAGDPRSSGRLTDEMRYMAGLQRVRYVFYYPDSKDIVLAGPAEGWVPDLVRPRRGPHHRAGRLSSYRTSSSP